MKFNPYLNFNGNAVEAFKFYQSVFGGEMRLVKMESAPGIGELSEKEKEMALHVSIQISKDQFLMASDCLESQGMIVQVGNNNYISIVPGSREEADRIFNGLSAGGTVEMPMDDMFWGEYFGSFKDKFGVCWMINFETASVDSVLPVHSNEMS